ncbi:MAG: hypothetical protein DCC55_28495 [Chloroflexi bacterium]|nr:MAG: hypothetical protein DCC55_28495 [Chloroflexota bacterium]
MERRERRGGNAAAVITVAVIAFVVVGVWWVESRFGSTTAILVLGGFFGVACLVIGYLLNLASTRYTLNTAADFNRDLAGVEKYRQQAFKEFARGDAAERTAQARIQVLDARRVDQLAQQRAGLLLDLERKRMEEQQRRQPPTWAVDDDEDGDFQRYQ